MSGHPRVIPNAYHRGYTQSSVREPSLEGSPPVTQAGLLNRADSFKLLSHISVHTVYNNNKHVLWAYDVPGCACQCRTH